MHDIIGNVSARADIGHYRPYRYRTDLKINPIIFTDFEDAMIMCLDVLAAASLPVSLNRPSPVPPLTDARSGSVTHQRVMRGRGREREKASFFNQTNFMSIKTVGEVFLFLN